MSDEIRVSGVLSKGYGLSPKLVMTDKDLSIEAKAIYSYLSSFCGDGTTAFPSVDLIRHHLNISKNRFYKYRNELVERGYIKVTRRHDGNKAMSNLYTLCLQIEDIQNEDIQIEDIQNEDTNNNSINNNSINNNREKKDIVGKPDSTTYKNIVGYLNKKIGSNYRPTSKKTQSLIKARYNEKFTEQDFYTVIDKKSKEWLGTEMEKYLRPETLFGNKFESYLNQKTRGDSPGPDNDNDQYDLAKHGIGLSL